MLCRRAQWLYHIATALDWEQAQRDGEYRTSTRGRSLSEEGFIHASSAAQVLPVADMLYATEQQDLLLLVHEPVPGWADPFPHIYGPLEVTAVARAVPLERDATGSFRWPAGLGRP
jgi:glutathione S-transferase